MRKKRKDRKARQAVEAENRKPEGQAGQNAEENEESPKQKWLPVLWRNSNKMRKWLPIVGAAAALAILFGIVCGLGGASGAAEDVPVSDGRSETRSESRTEASDGNADSLSEWRDQIKEQAEEPVEASGEDQEPSEGEEENQADGGEKEISVSGTEPVPTLSADRAEQSASPVQPAASAASAAGSGQEQQVQSHTHHWVEQTETITHEAVTQQVYVVDQAAWEEPVYEEVPVYETYGVEVCGVCGAEMYSSAEVSAHAETHIDWETLSNPFYYYTDWRQRQVGTETVQTGTIHHEEQGHYEEQVVQAAYMETKVTGYRCSECGAKR